MDRLTNVSASIAACVVSENETQRVMSVKEAGLPGRAGLLDTGSAVGTQPAALDKRLAVAAEASVPRHCSYPGVRTRMTWSGCHSCPSSVPAAAPPQATDAKVAKTDLDAMFELFSEVDTQVQYDESDLAMQPKPALQAALGHCTTTMQYGQHHPSTRNNSVHDTLPVVVQASPSGHTRGSDR